ncbi:hypothetical protein [Oscillospiraceae bacterium]|nr:hypothetical protein [Oscillospiraceae bacterium]
MGISFFLRLRRMKARRILIETRIPVFQDFVNKYRPGRLTDVVYY